MEGSVISFCLFFIAVFYCTTYSLLMNVLLYIVRTYRGLSHSGEEGVYNVLKLLNDELALAMKLMGATTITVSTCFFFVMNY